MPVVIQDAMSMEGFYYTEWQYNPYQQNFFHMGSYWIDTPMGVASANNFSRFRNGAGGSTGSFLLVNERFTNSLNTTMYNTTPILEDWQRYNLQGVETPNSDYIAKLSSGYAQWPEQCHMFGKSLACNKDGTIIIVGSQGYVSYMDTNYHGMATFFYRGFSDGSEAQYGWYLAEYAIKFNEPVIGDNFAIS